MKSKISERIFHILFRINSALKTGFTKFWIFIWDLVDEFYHYNQTWVYKKFRSSSRFKLNNKIYPYFYHNYNFTWRAERAVEIPIIIEILKRNKGKRILEIGNVLSHYFSHKHDILDKYEKGEGVINEDIVNFYPKKKYDLIISISTLEHVGWHEAIKEPLKILNAIEHLKSYLTNKGEFVFTIPIGENPFLDNLLKENKIKFSEKYCLKKISFDNKWKQVS
ncbi:MAG: hypothetical protein V3V33_11840, partial [Candidatus Lokiarchaeia archaeon]